jgi:hypothetical protein
MASAGAIKAGRAYYELYADRDPLVKGLKGAERLVKSSVAGVSAKVLAMGVALGASVTAAIAAVAAPGAAAKLFASMGSELTDLSRRTGASASALSSLGYAAKQTGSDLASIEGLLTHVRDKTMEAARGSDQAQLAFARLGINFLELSQLAPADQLRLIGARLKEIPNPALRAAAAIDLLGSADMLPTLERLGEMEARAKSLGLVLSDEDSAAAKQFQMSLTDLWESLKFLGETIGAKLAPLLKDFVDWTAKVISEVKKWIDVNGDLESHALLFWAQLKLAWLEGTYALTNAWNSMTFSLISAMIDASASIEKIWNNTFTRIMAGVAKVALMLEKKGLLSELESGAIDFGFGMMGSLMNAQTEQRSEDAQLELAKKGGPDLFAHMAKVIDLEDEIDRLKAEAQKKRENKAGDGAALSSASRQGIATALIQTKGIGAQDVRTLPGFAGVMQSLRQQQVSPAMLQQQQLANDVHILRIAAEKIGKA